MLFRGSLVTVCHSFSMCNRACHSFSMCNRAARCKSAHAYAPCHAHTEWSSLPCLQAKMLEVPSAEQLVDGAVAIAESSSGTVFSLSSLLSTLCSHEDGRDRTMVIARLLHHLRGPPGVSLDARAAGSLLAPAHLLAVLATDDVAAREAAQKEGKGLYPPMLAYPGTVSCTFCPGETCGRLSSACWTQQRYANPVEASASALTWQPRIYTLHLVCSAKDKGLYVPMHQGHAMHLSGFCSSVHHLLASDSQLTMCNICSNAQRF